MHMYKDIHNLNIASQRIEKSPNFFSSMKKSNMVKFNYIKKINPDLALGYMSYIEEMEEVKNEIVKHYYILSNYRLVAAFSNYLYDQKITNHSRSFVGPSLLVLFNKREGFTSHKTYLKYVVILSKLKEYIKNETAQKEKIAC